MRLQKNNVVFAGYVYKHKVNDKYYAVIRESENEKIVFTDSDKYKAINWLTERLGEI